ncbi:AraC family transcriptional regulator [Nocardioides sp.]|uniref:helix-turn-helix domain-containing protein n=1 Tax=Nocardioides sp. TaxID=35761 RepID=UPI00273318E7|nr:helix-turn-helix domain-containing protein [Nocardioides sp.]MDP3892893.1 helix-turn-helix domain-containing protein [Nocardioides sp.]
MAEDQPVGGSGYVSWTPSAALRGHVADLTAYDVVVPGPGTHRGLPSTGLTVVLPIDDPLDVGWSADPASRGAFEACVSGLHTESACIRHDGIQRGVMLSLTPAGCRALLGVPAAALAAQLVELTEVAHDLADLPEQLAEQSGWRRRLRLVEDRLVSALSARDGSLRRIEAGSAEVERAMVGLAEGMRVGAVAHDVGYSRRHLGSLFRAECGVTPKEYQRIARFEKSRHRLAHEVRRWAGAPSLAAVAVACGYADQAHLTREWRELAGVPPTTWLREEFPFLQDRGGDPA